MKNLKIAAFADEAGNALCEQIKAMDENGLFGLEIRGVDGKNVVDLTLDEIRNIKSRLNDKNLAIWSMGSPMGKIGIKDDFAPHLDAFKRLLELTYEAQAKCIRLFSFYMPKDEKPEIYRDEVFERLNRFCETAKGSGIILCHENEKGIYGDTAERCLDIHKNIPELSAVFDPANFVQCGEDTLKAWSLLSQYVYYLHIKDALYDSTVVPAGKGEGHLREILADYKGEVVTLEPHLEVFEGLSALEGGEQSIVGKNCYPTQRAAFDDAVLHLKKLLEEMQ